MIPYDAVPQAPEVTTRSVGREQIEEEFSAYYRRFAKRLAGWLILQGVSEADAYDVVQETMRKALRNWVTIRNPEAWARTTASRMHAKRLAEGDTVPVEDIDDRIPRLTSGGSIAAIETEQDFREALQKLPPRQRQVLAWSFEGYAPAEIAEQLRMTPESVRSNLYKARRTLDQLLQIQDPGQ